ncbi:MAG: hypothetical protein II875_09995 [Clostridia bacterium]|nr:hypothetical protein [Clostridia bacterium]
MTVYTGSGTDKARAARVNARIPKRKARMRTASLVQILSLLILLTVAGTCLIVRSASAMDASKQLAASHSYQISLSNHIKTLQFEIRRETQGDMLLYNARTRLGMVSMGALTLPAALTATADAMK